MRKEECTWLGGIFRVSGDAGTRTIQKTVLTTDMLSLKVEQAPGTCPLHLNPFKEMRDALGDSDDFIES